MHHNTVHKGECLYDELGIYSCSVNVFAIFKILFCAYYFKCNFYFNKSSAIALAIGRSFSKTE